MDDDLACPKCGASVTKGPKRGDRDNYECRGCGVAFSVSGSDWPAIRAGDSARLKPDASGSLWLRPDSRHASVECVAGVSWITSARAPSS
jgi:hypothetical protein